MYMRCLLLLALLAVSTASSASARWWSFSPSAAPNITVGTNCTSSRNCSRSQTCAYRPTAFPAPTTNVSTNNTYCFTVASFRGACNLTNTTNPVVCGAGQECYSGQCRAVNPLGTVCAMPGQGVDWCGGCGDGLLQCLSPSNTGTKYCAAPAYNGTACSAQAGSVQICVGNGAVCSTDAASPLGLGICTNGLVKPANGWRDVFEYYRYYW